MMKNVVTIYERELSGRVLIFSHPEVADKDVNDFLRSNRKADHVMEDADINTNLGCPVSVVGEAICRESPKGGIVMDGEDYYFPRYHTLYDPKMLESHYMDFNEDIVVKSIGKWLWWRYKSIDYEVLRYNDYFSRKNRIRLNLRFWGGIIIKEYGEEYCK